MALTQMWDWYLAPAYCSDLTNLGNGLYNFYENSGYLPALLNLNTAVAQSEHIKSVISTPSSTFTYISRPLMFIISISSWKENSVYMATFAQLQGKKKLYEGFYDSSMIYGDHITPERAAKLAHHECAKVEIQFESDNIGTRYYLTATTLHAPPQRERSKVSVLPLSLKAQKSSITVMLEESFDSITQVTAMFECPSSLP